MITVVVLAASPRDQDTIYLGKELKIIKDTLDRSQNRGQYRIEQCTATTVDDLRRYLIEHQPRVLHFCGHGGSGGICFEDEAGATQLVSGEQLAKLLHIVSDTLKCVVLSACYSQVQAKLISDHIDFVVGMNDKIGDDMAYKFAQGFYEAMWGGYSFEKAFQFGCSAIHTANLPAENVPIFITSPRLGTAALSYSEETQAIENFVLAFLNSVGEARAQMTTEPDKYVDQFKEKAATERPQAYSSAVVRSVKPVGDINIEVEAIVTSGASSQAHTFYLQRHSTSFLIDVDATFGLWPIPFKTLMALGSTGPLQIRVIAELADYHNYGFEKEHFVSVRMRNLDHHDLYGFVLRQEPSDLVDLLRDGKAHRVIVEIMMTGENNSCVFISQLVSSSWIAPTPESA